MAKPRRSRFSLITPVPSLRSVGRHVCLGRIFASIFSFWVFLFHQLVLTIRSVSVCHCLASSLSVFERPADAPSSDQNFVPVQTKSTACSSDTQTHNCSRMRSVSTKPVLHCCIFSHSLSLCLSLRLKILEPNRTAPFCV